MINYTDKYIRDLFESLGYSEEIFPYDPIGLVMFLKQKKIEVFIYPKDNAHDKYMWVGVDINEGDNVFSQDLTEYEKFDDAVNSAIIEGISYLSLKKNDRKV